MEWFKQSVCVFFDNMRILLTSINIRFGLLISCSVRADTVGVNDILRRVLRHRNHQFRHHLTSAHQYPTHLTSSSFDRISHPSISFDRTSHPIISVDNTPFPSVSEAAKLVFQ